MRRAATVRGLRKARIVNRFVPLLAGLFLLGVALPALAKPLRGTVVLREDPAATSPRVLVQTAEGREVEVRGELLERIRLFEGRAVELEGGAVKLDGPGEAFAVEAIVSPREEVLAATVARDAEGTWLEAGDRRLRAAGRTALLEPGERVRALVSLFPDDVALVEAVEAETNSTWTVAHQLASRASLPADLIRGKRRSVWITARATGWLRVRRGEREGWVRAERIDRVRPPKARRAASRGLIGGVPQER